MCVYDVSREKKDIMIIVLFRNEPILIVVPASIEYHMAHTGSHYAKYDDVMPKCFILENRSGQS